MQRHTDTIISLVCQDSLRLEALKHTRALDLPNGYIAAGFIRNLVWDHFHDKTTPTPLNDIDVIYFNDDETNIDQCYEYESQLKAAMPEVNWQVRNQSLMHTRNGDPKYLSILDAMSYWPEKETAVAIRLLNDDTFECLSSFGLESLFQGKATCNPKRGTTVFESRLASKNWLDIWPNLTISK